ncbi:MAG: tRNA (5-methylaminomethyl-2-thiouridine)(34)-methyltransferase MnmD [Pseudomonadota bacterium]
MATEPIAPARARWDGDHWYSLDAEDVYFSRDALDEVRRVFMAPVQLEDRFAQCARRTFTVGELGFGSGLNCAVIAEAFLRRAPTTARLHLISVDARPFCAEDLDRAARHWRASLPIYAELAAAYPALLGGWHRRRLAAGRVTLSLYFGTACAALADIVDRQQQPIDHWCLDGFAPDRNPEMWSPELFGQLAQLSRGARAAGSERATTVSTFTAVGQVRRDLRDAGFDVRRVDQRPHKLHSTAGHFVGAGRRDWAAPRRVTVRGAGIAGASVARALAERGVVVQVCAPGKRSASHASRIPAAVLHGRLHPGPTTAADWQLASFHHAHQRLIGEPGYAATGVLQLPGPNTPADRLGAIWRRYAASGAWLTEAPGAVEDTWARGAAGLAFKIGGIVEGRRLCRALLAHSDIEWREEPSSADEASANPTTASECGTPLVLANAIATRQHAAARYLELASIAGQIDLCSHPQPLTQPVVGDGYAAPYRGGVAIGATYEYRPLAPREASASNLARWPDLRPRGRFRAARTVTSDRLPVFGALYDPTLAPLPGVQVLTGFGSSGMSAAPLAAECVAASLCGEFAPISSALQAALDGRRFRERQARRGPRMGAAD